MAVDTRAKRSSALNPASPWRGLWAAPDGTVGQGDRQAVAFMYSGILAAGAAVPVVEVQIAATLYGTSAVAANLTGTRTVAVTLHDQ